MKLIDMSIRDFLEEVDSNKPAPGGGSVSALASSLGLGLSRMVGHLTFNKKKFEGLEEEIKQIYKDNFSKLEIIINKMKPLIDEDTEAFNEIMNAFRLPKETEEDKSKRHEAIQTATLNAIKVPLAIAELSYEGLLIIKDMIDYGNKNAITDIGVGALLLSNGLEGAILNVLVNLSGLDDQNLVTKYSDRCSFLRKEANNIKDQLLYKVYKGIA